MHNLPDLAKAMSLARAFEQKQQMLEFKNKHRGTWHGNEGNFISPANMTVLTSQISESSNTLGGTTEANSVNLSTPFIKKSRAKMAERRAKGLR